MFNSSRSQVLCKKGLLKNFTELTGKHLYWSLFLIKLQALLKADFSTGVFLLILRNFWEYLFYRTSPGDCFWMFNRKSSTKSQWANVCELLQMKVCISYWFLHVIMISLLKPMISSKFQLQWMYFSYISSYDLNVSCNLKMYRSSFSQIFFQIGVLKNFAVFTGKHLYCSLFIIHLQAWKPKTLLKRDSNTCKRLLYK